MKQKIMNSKFGKILRRLVGDEAGAVMMEYVIVAVLVAAAALVAVIYFGQAITNQASSATSAVAGQSADAVSEHNKAVSSANSAKTEALTHAEKFSDKTGN